MLREVIAQPVTHAGISSHGLQVITAPSSPSAAEQGNQGNALVVRKMTSFPSYYARAPSGRESSCNTAYFRCAPRPVLNGRLRIKVFEQHPYTRQAFIPMGTDKRERAYLVVVAEDRGIRLYFVLRSEPYSRWQARSEQNKSVYCEGEYGNRV